jgi:hypothetical protein
MHPATRAVLAFIVSCFRSRLSMQIEILALRHQLSLYQRTTKRPRIRPIDRILSGLVVEDLVTLAGGSRHCQTRHRHRLATSTISKSLGSAEPFGQTRASCRGQGDPRFDTQDVLGQPVMGISPFVVAELKKLGIDVAKSSVEKYMVKTAKPSSPTWRAFLENRCLPHLLLAAVTI